MKFIDVGMFMLLVLHNCCPNCFAERDQDDDLDSGHLFEKIVDFINPHSVFYNKGSKQMVPVEFTESETNVALLGSAPSQQEDGQEYVFYKRFVKVLLLNIVPKFDDENQSGSFMVEGTLTDLEILQDFVDGKASIREADRILSKIIMEPKVTDTIDYVFSLYDVIKENIQVTLAVICCIISYLWLRNAKWSPAVIVLTTTIVIFVISFFIVWYRMIQEAQIKHMVLQQQHADIPVSCQPDKMSMWDKIKGLLQSEDACEKYYKSKMSNPIFEVTPAVALMHLLTIVILHPVAHSGVVINKFITSVTANTPFFFSIFYQSYLYLCVGILIIILPIACITGSLSFGIGPFSILSFGGRKTKSQKSLENNSKLQRIENVEKISSNDGNTQNNRQTPEILCIEDYAMADGDRIRNIKTIASKDEICSESKSKNELCSKCDNENEKEDKCGDC